MQKLFHSQRAKAAKKAKSILKAAKSGLRKEQQKTPDQIADEIYEAIQAEFLKLPNEVRDALASSASAGALQGLQDLAITNPDMISSVQTLAMQWAEKRSAEMVGMRLNADGKLVENPNAKWRIDTTTRNELKAIVEDAFSEETSMSDLISEIQDAGAFSEARAKMIANTEVSIAQTNGNFEAWKTSGMVEKVKWLLSEDHEVPDECDDNEDEEVDLGDEFPSGDMMPPAHPNCWCALVASVITEGE